MQNAPSTKFLRALDSFARHGSVWKVADELNLTRSAVSHQLRGLERDLGFPLFVKSGTGICLTPRGRAYAADAARALEILTTSAARNIGRDLTGLLTVSCTPGFAATWLATRIGQFREMCPDLTLCIVTPERLDDLSNPTVDLFIAFGHENLAGPGMSGQILQEVSFTPLCSPVLLNRLGGLSEPADVLGAGLLHLNDTRDWQSWAREAGLSTEDFSAGTMFSDMNLVYAAALSAQGIAMGDEFICRAAMTSGLLLKPFDLTIKSPSYYQLIIPNNRQNMVVVNAFRNWIVQELDE